VFETGRRVASDLFVALDSKRPTIAVAVPVTRQGQVRYVLEMSIEPEVFVRLLAEQRPPQEAVETIVDNRGLVIARTSDADRRLGGPMATELAAQAARSDEGSGEGSTREGAQVYHVFTRSPLTGWRTSVAMPQAIARGSLNESLLFLAGGAALAAIVSLGVAFLAGRRIARPISTLASLAGAIARGRAVHLSGSTVREVVELRDALVAAGEAANVAAAEHARRLVAESQQAEAQAASRSKDEFLAMLGHELRNPLGVIAGAASLLDQPGLSEAVTKRYPAIIRRQVRHLSRLVDDLLDVSRVTSGKIELFLQPVDLAEVVANAVHEWRTAGRLDAHQFTLEASPVWVNADVTRMEQVVENVVTNALKYTPPGGRIDVTVGADQGQAYVRVRDSGIGIPPALLPRVFDLFTQGHTGPGRASGGLGIGLTLARRLVELHGGVIAAESAGDHRGATFTIRLPAVARPVVTAPPAVGAATGPATSRRVLVVDDVDDAREMLRVMLVVRGHQVFEAADGPDAVDAAQRIRPDLALIDVGLPGLDGYEVARRIRRLPPPHPRLVALTGYGSPDDRARALEAGFDEHLVKPVDPQRLEAVLVGGPPPARSVGAMAYRRDPVQDAADQLRWSHRLRQQARTARRATRDLVRRRADLSAPGSPSAPWPRAGR
jgi:signal transduction histidine kinase/ActR/RegA family two-component response regulator